MGELERGIVFALFQEDDGLPPHARTESQLFLSHLKSRAEFSDPIFHRLRLLANGFGRGKIRLPVLDPLAVLTNPIVFTRKATNARDEKDCEESQ